MKTILLAVLLSGFGGVQSSTPRCTGEDTGIIRVAGDCGECKIGGVAGFFAGGRCRPCSSR